MVGIQLEKTDLRAVYRKSGSVNLMERLSEEYLIFLRRYHPLRFLRIVAHAENPGPF